MVAIFARPNHTRVFVEVEGDLGLEREARTLEDDFGTEFFGHSANPGRLYNAKWCKIDFIAPFTGIRS
jgi:hypothetical protein